MSALPATSSPALPLAADLDAAVSVRWRALQQEVAAFIDRVDAGDRAYRAAIRAGVLRVCERPGFRIPPERDRVMILDRVLSKLPSFTRLRRQYKRTDASLRLNEVRMRPMTGRYSDWAGAEPGVAIIRHRLAFVPPNWFEEREWVAAACGKHSLAPCLQRGSGGIAGLLADLQALVDGIPGAAKQMLDADDRLEIHVQIASGIWRGRLAGTDAEPFVAFRTFV
jgi:hypothetical protein